VSLLVMPDGALLVSDDLGGRIWRVSFGESSPADGPGDLNVTTATTGSDPDPDGYTVTMDETTDQPIEINGSVTFSGLSAGSHTVALAGVAPNCSVDSPYSQTVTVPSGGTATTSFTITCTTPPGDGDLTVTTSTSGSSLDPDGYRVRLDGGSARTLGINSTFTYTNLAAGDHRVVISGVAANCTVSDGRSRTVSVPSGGTATVAYSVSCTTPPGDLTVTTSTSGSSQPSGYTVTVDETQSQAIASDGSVTFTNVAAGSHSVALTDVPADCTVDSSNPQTITVPSGESATTSFSVSCTTPIGDGDLTVTTSTSGSSLPSGYTVMVDGGQSQAIGSNGSVTFTHVSAGSHSVALTSVASNCTVSGANPQTVTVPSDGAGTAPFSATCTTANRQPIVNAGSDQGVVLGVSYALSDASFSDPDNDGPWSYTIEWGDGSTATGSKSSQGSLTGAHNYLLPGTYQITVTVTDNHGAAGSDSKLLKVGTR
jgi:hypothetical protein